MVKIVDLTEEKEREMKQAKLEEQLAKECFVGKEVCSKGALAVFQGSEIIAFMDRIFPRMKVYDQNILSQAETFAKKYEEKFGLDGDFVIETDYSKSK